MVTKERLMDVLSRRGGVLKSGPHGDCESGCCAMECLAIAIGQTPNDKPHGDSPRDTWSRIMNDAAWSTDLARTEAMLPTLLLPEPDDGWAARIAEATIRRVLPEILREIAPLFDAEHKGKLLQAAELCEAEGTKSAARSAARSAAESAESARSAARSAESAAWSAARSAESAAESAAAARDKYLRLGVQIAIDCWQLVSANC